MRRLVLLVTLSLLGLVAAAPLASASEESVPSCVLDSGAVNYAVCWAKVGSCAAWRAAWGPDEPCPD